MYAKTYQLSVEQGRQSAEQVANAPETVANPIIVYSVNDLAITGPDVSVTTMGYGESGFHFRYDGLLLFALNDGRYFFLPSGWHGTGPGPWRMPLTIVSDSPDVRVELVGS